ncbi:MAG: XRE family transcriptional regulator [Rhizonema sp. PD37]|nr:XRE family transcriptional regulator [Rhizonema sp. PD37]
MHYRDAFNQTLEKFKISAKSLSLSSGVQERQISHFRNGKDLMAETLFALVAALPNEAQMYYFSCVGGESALQTVDLRSLVKSMPITRKYEVLSIIAASLMESPENTDQSKFMPAAL